MIVNSPQGQPRKNLVTLKTWPLTTTQQSLMVLCFETSVML